MAEHRPKYDEARGDAEKLEAILYMSKEELAAYQARREVQRKLEDVVIQARNEVADLYAKLELLAMELETEDGIFTFPDGEAVQTRKRVPLVVSVSPVTAADDLAREEARRNTVFPPEVVGKREEKS